MKVQPISHVSFETTKSRFIQILHHCSVSWKITSPYFFLSQTFILWTKRPHQSEILRLLSSWMKIRQIPYVMFETTSQFFFKLCIILQCSVSWEITLLHFFNWNCTWFEQKEPIRVQNFRLSTAHVKFHQFCTLISSFCYIKF